MLLKLIDFSKALFVKCFLDNLFKKFKSLARVPPENGTPGFKYEWIPKRLSDFIHFSNSSNFILYFFDICPISFINDIEQARKLFIVCLEISAASGLTKYFLHLIWLFFLNQNP